MFACRACGSDKIFACENEKGRIILIRAYFDKEITWQEALKRVGISDKGVKAKTREHGTEAKRTITTLTGSPVVRPGFNVTFYTEVYSDKKPEYELWIEN